MWWQLFDGLTGLYFPVPRWKKPLTSTSCLKLWPAVMLIGCVDWRTTCIRTWKHSLTHCVSRPRMTLFWSTFHSLDWKLWKNSGLFFNVWLYPLIRFFRLHNIKQNLESTMNIFSWIHRSVPWEDSPDEGSAEHEDEWEGWDGGVPAENRRGHERHQEADQLVLHKLLLQR